MIVGSEQSIYLKFAKNTEQNSTPALYMRENSGFLKALSHNFK